MQCTKGITICFGFFNYLLFYTLNLFVHSLGKKPLKEINDT